jgi:hypothetical protein
LCRVVDAHDGLEGLRVPDWTTGRSWLMQLGLSQLRRPMAEADDWVWMVDHSIQSGRDRLLAVLGGRLSEMPSGAPLRRCDLRLLHLAVMRDPDMESNRDELLGLARRTGVPRVLLSDHGADLRGGVRLLREALGAGAGRMLELYDVKHRTALALKHRLEGCPRWAEFLAGVGGTRNALKQTEWAFLLPPVLRSKSRYLNLGDLVPWACRLRFLLEHEPAALLEHGSPEKLRQKMGWLLGFGAELHRWRGWYRVAARTEEVIRNRGLYRGVEQNLEVRLSGLMKDESSAQMAGELKAFVVAQSAGLSLGERVPGSTEVLESCFGTLKALEKDQSKGGFTGLVLGLGALVGEVTKEVVAQALRSTPVKAVRNWCKQNIGTSMQSKRQQAFRLAGV